MIAIPAAQAHGTVNPRPIRRRPVNTKALQDLFAALETWATAGYTRAQIRVDGKPGSSLTIEQICDIVGHGALTIQASTSSRDEDLLDRLLSCGAAGVVLSAASGAAYDQQKDLARRFPGSLVITASLQGNGSAPANSLKANGTPASRPMGAWQTGASWADWARLENIVEELAELPMAGVLLELTPYEWASMDVSQQSFDHANFTPNSSPRQESTLDSGSLSHLEDLAINSAWPLMVSAPFANIDELRALEHRGIGAAILDMKSCSALLDERSTAEEFAV